MEDSERPKKFCFQLPFALILDILAVQPNFLVGSIVLGFDSLIVSLFLKFLGMVEIFSANDHQLFEFGQKLVRQLRLGAGVDIFLVQHLRVVDTVQLKRHVTSARIPGIVVSKLRYL